MRAADGWVALNLSRDEDAALVPALIGRDVTGDPFVAVEQAELSTAALAAQAALLGLPLAVISETRRPAAIVAGGGARHGGGMRVLDLSALWAGPLCAALLLGAGASVARIENARRPDRSRTGHPGFYARLNHGKAMAMLDLPRETDRLRNAIAAATW
ncbi:MAG: CoA transferase [Sphingomonas taxi]